MYPLGMDYELFDQEIVSDLEIKQRKKIFPTKLHIYFVKANTIQKKQMQTVNNITKKISSLYILDQS